MFPTSAIVIRPEPPTRSPLKFTCLSRSKLSELFLLANPIGDDKITQVVALLQTILGNLGDVDQLPQRAKPLLAFKKIDRDLMKRRLKESGFSIDFKFA